VKSSSARDPVFVDSTGHRHRTIRRAGALLAVPAVAYLVLLGSSLLGGPRMDTPLIPLPESARRQPAPRPQETNPPIQAVDTPKPEKTSASPDPSTEPGSTPTPTATPVVSTPTIAPVTTTASPTAGGKSTTAPTAPPSTGHGRPSAPPGRTKTPPSKP